MIVFSGSSFARWRDPEFKRFIRFLAVGGLNTLVGYCIFASLILVGLPTPAAIVIGTIVGVLFNFQSTGRIVFRSKGHSLLPRFLAVYAVQMGLNIVAMGTLERLGLHPLIACAIVLPPLVVFTYLAMRRFVYS